jgi:hypothetical protein
MSMAETWSNIEDEARVVDAMMDDEIEAISASTPHSCDVLIVLSEYGEAIEEEPCT